MKLSVEGVCACAARHQSFDFVVSAPKPTRGACQTPTSGFRCSCLHQPDLLSEGEYETSISFLYKVVLLVPHYELLFVIMSRHGAATCRSSIVKDRAIVRNGKQNDEAMRLA